MRYHASRYLSASLHALPRFALLERLFSRSWRNVAQKLRQLNEVPLARRGLAPGKPDLALRFRRTETQQADVALCVHLAGDGHLRQKRDAIAVGDHLHDGGEAGGAEAIAGLWRQHMAIGQRLVAHAMALLEQEEAIMGQHLGAGVAEPLIALRRLGRENEPVVEQMQRLDLWIVDGERDEDEVEASGDELMDEIRGQGLAELQIERGK